MKLGSNYHSDPAYSNQLIAITGRIGSSRNIFQLPEWVIQRCKCQLCFLETLGRGNTLTVVTSNLPGAKKETLIAINGVITINPRISPGFGFTAEATKHGFKGVNGDVVHILAASPPFNPTPIPTVTPSLPLPTPPEPIPCHNPTSLPRT